MKVVNVGESYLLATLIPFLETAVYRLYKNDVAVTPELVIEDLVEADYSGYAPQDLDALGNAWSAPGLAGDGRFVTTGDTDAEFMHDGGATDNTLYGWYLTDAAGELLAAEALPEPFAMDAEGKSVVIHPYFSLQSRDEVESIDTTPPELESATIDATGELLTLVFSEPVTGSDTFTIDPSGGPANITYDAGDGTATVTFTIDVVVAAGETVTLAYAAGDVQDLAGNPLADFADFAVVNDSASAFDPLADVPGLVLWLDSQYGLYQERTGAGATTPAAGDGDPVGTWAYRTGGADGYLTAAADGARPVLKLAIQNGLPVLRWDGTDDLLTSAALGGGLTQPLTVFVVAKSTSTAVVRTLIDGSGARCVLQTDTGTGYGRIYAGSLLTGAANLTGAWRLFTAVFNGASSSLRIDGAGYLAGSAGTMGLDLLKVGSDGVSAPLAGDIAEILICGTLSDPDRDAVEAYLNARWGVY